MSQPDMSGWAFQLRRLMSLRMNRLGTVFANYIQQQNQSKLSRVGCSKGQKSKIKESVSEDLFSLIPAGKDPPCCVQLPVALGIP